MIREPEKLKERALEIAGISDPVERYRQAGELFATLKPEEMAFVGQVLHNLLERFLRK